MYGGGGLNTETTSDSRHVKLLQKQQQVLQEQLEESQRELAKAHAEAAKSAASQQQEPAATAQNMTSTIQTGKKSAKTTPVDGDEDEDSQGKLPDSQPVPRIKYIREVYDEDAKRQSNLIYVVQFKSDGSFKKVHSVLQRDFDPGAQRHRLYGLPSLPTRLAYRLTATSLNYTDASRCTAFHRCRHA